MCVGREVCVTGKMVGQRAARFFLPAAFLLALLSGGCGLYREEAGGWPRSYEETAEEELPEALKERISGEREEPFLAAYGDGTWLYIAVGYGRQETGGYTVRVESLTETEHTLRIRASLTGPGSDAEAAGAAGAPFAAVRTAYTEKRIISER